MAQGSVLDDLVDAIQSRSDLAHFVKELRASLLQPASAWENATLEAYLGALGAWVNDMDGYFANRGQETPIQPTWSLVATMLLAATVYE